MSKPPRKASTHRIALAFPLGVPYLERITRGVAEFARTHARWQLVFSPEAVAPSIESLRADRPDGVLAFVASRKEARAFAALGVPVVNLSSGLLATGLPTVTIDNRAVGALAAQHLLDRGFRRFAYYGLRDVVYGRERGAGFVSAIRAAGFSCTTCTASSGIERGRPSLLDLRQLRAWVRRLVPPVGLLAAHDYRARAVLDVCASLGLRVPEDVAVVGVDDDVVACELATPTLTSVALPGLELGREAAAVLAALLTGNRAPVGTVRVAPREVIARRSTDVLAIGDAIVVEAARIIHDRMGEPLDIPEIAAEVGISRRSLERRFRTAVGASPHDYLTRARVDRAKVSLRTTPGADLKQVAAACGFSDPRRMNVAFRQLEGHTPQQFRASLATPSQNARSMSQKRT